MMLYYRGEGWSMEGLRHFEFSANTGTIYLNYGEKNDVIIDGEAARLILVWLHENTHDLEHPPKKAGAK